MIEFIDVETLRPIQFEYSSQEHDAACFSAEFYRNMAGRFAEALARPTELIERDHSHLTYVQAELLEGRIVTVRSHLLIAKKVLPTVVRLDEFFRVGEVLNPDVQYGDVCDGYGVNADDLARYAPIASDMIRAVPEIRHMG